MLTLFRNSFLEKIVKSNLVLLAFAIRFIERFKFLFLPFETEWNAFKYISINKNELILDIGGHLGESIFLFSKYYPENKIYSFEPIDFLYKKILKNFKNKNIKIFNYGFSDKEENKIFFPVLNNYPISLWAASSREKLINRLREYTYIKNFNIVSKKVKYKKNFNTKDKVAIIKIDVEGYEHVCLEALKKIILRDKPILFIEYNKENHKQVKSFLSKKKYKCYFFKNNEKKLIRVNNIENFNKKIKRRKRAVNFIYSVNKINYRKLF